MGIETDTTRIRHKEFNLFYWLENFKLIAGNDRVAVDSDDDNPDYLFSKLEGGDNVTLIDTGNAVKIDVTGVTDDKTVLVDSEDRTSGFLSDKIEAGENTYIQVLETETENFLIINAYDEKVKTADDDPISGFLENKIISGDNISITKVGGIDDPKQLEISAVNVGKVLATPGDETPKTLSEKIWAGDNITITSSGTEDSHLNIISANNKVCSDSYDFIPGTLDEKIQAGDNITITPAPSNDQDRPLTISAVLDHKVLATQDDSVAGNLSDKIDIADNMMVTIVDNPPDGKVMQLSATDNKVKISNNDNQSNVLEQKIIAGSNIDITKINTGANEQLQISATGMGEPNDEKVKATSEDTVAGFLDAKVNAGSNMNIYSEDDDENGIILTFDASDSKVNTTDSDIALSLSHKIAGGNNITTEIVNIAESINGQIIHHNQMKINATIPPESNKAKVSSNDETAEYLEEKIISGDNISITKLNSGADEKLQISTTGGSSTDELVKVSADDSASQYLESKIHAGSNIEVVKVTEPGDPQYIKVSAPNLGKILATTDDETPKVLKDKLIAGDNIEIFEHGVTDSHLTISATDGKVYADSADFTNGVLSEKIAAGENIEIESIGGGDRQLQISATDNADVKVSDNDTTAGYLKTKLTGNMFVNLIEQNDGDDETLMIQVHDTPDSKVMADGEDSIAGYLFDKIEAGNNISVAVHEYSEQNKLVINSSDKKVIACSSDPNAGYLNEKIVAGDGIEVDCVVNELNRYIQITDGGECKVNDTDTTLGYLQDKIYAGDNITLGTSAGDNVKLLINASDKSVGVDENDILPGFLADKLVAGNNITLTKASDSSSITIDAGGGGGGNCNTYSAGFSNSFSISAGDTVANVLEFTGVNAKKFCVMGFRVYPDLTRQSSGDRFTISAFIQQKGYAPPGNDNRVYKSVNLKQMEVETADGTARSDHFTPGNTFGESGEMIELGTTIDGKKEFQYLKDFSLTTSLFDDLENDYSSRTGRFANVLEINSVVLENIDKTPGIPFYIWNKSNITAYLYVEADIMIME